MKIKTEHQTDSVTLRASDLDAYTKTESDERYALKGEGAVTSVNGQTGDVVLSADDVEAVPTATSAESGYVLTANGRGGVAWRAQTGGVTDAHINELIDAKIGTLETLANAVSEVVG